jgi:hypothetical protein
MAKRIDANKTIEAFDLSTKRGRYEARRHGFSVPKYKPGPAPGDFWSQVLKTETCWLWQGETNQDGYGRYHNRGEHMAHRWAWTESGSDSIEGRVLRHVVCDNPPCVRPEHCMPGTHQDNQLDKVLKNRQAKGDVNGSSKLTTDQVLEMRQLKKAGMKYKDIAAKFQVSYDATQKAIRGINWSHV